MSVYRFCPAFVITLAFVFLPLGSDALGQQSARPKRMRLVKTPAVSPDGNQIAFSWNGEIWSAKIDGTDIKRLTANDASDQQPIYSPDGGRIAFLSDRSGSEQIWIMNTDGTQLRQSTFHSGGYELCDWFPDGKHVLAVGSRDHFHRDSKRLIKVNIEQRTKEIVLADAMAENARVSPDGENILFTREGERWWRKGYQGQRASQIWIFNIASQEFSELVHEETESLWPIWMADGKGFFFTQGALHGFDLWKFRFSKKSKTKGKQKRVFGFEDDSIVYPSLSRDGKTLVFRHLFDLYSLKVGSKKPKKIELQVGGDVDVPNDELRRELSDATDVAFSPDGLEIAFVAGGDIWIMDTILKEPKRITRTDGYEDDLVFSSDGNELWYAGNTDGQVDIWKAKRKDDEKFWWQNDSFQFERVTEDAHVESDLRFTPDGEQLIMQQGRGDLVRMDLKGKAKTKFVSGFSGIDYDISADSQWIAYSQQDDDFNREIWIRKLDGSGDPVNVSRHPDNDGGPKFSPDGKLLAFTGRRIDDEVDLYYVYLQREEDQTTSRDRKIDEALELMKKKRKSKPTAKKEPEDSSKSKSSEAKKTDKNDTDKSEEEKPTESKEDEKSDNDKKAKPIKIDFEGIHERLRKISIPNSRESGLLFSPDSKKLAFSATIDGKNGWYTVEFPSELKPKLLTTSRGSKAVWSKEADAILFLKDGSPARIDKTGKLTTYSFRVAQETSRSGWLKAGFNRAWLTMRESWYDKRFANHNWADIRRKYADAAGEMYDTAGLADVVQLMLGELNGSHLGFYPSGSSQSSRVEGWSDQTAHLGVRFVDDHQGPGLLVRDVLKNGPANREDGKVLAGDLILSIDGTAVDPAMDLTPILNGRLDRDIQLAIQRGNGKKAKELKITVRPISFSRARSLLYEHWLDHNRKLVDESSDGKLGYLHIRAMNMSSFYDFERQLYNVGYGREGLVIDVRDNGGGSTTDLLLTALTQPRHAITQPRGGGQGYPHDRAVFASWAKPIIVLCNQNSYSNAEIFSHAIKTLGRGKVVGVRTAGGVISTGSASINDVGRIRVPFRGWFLIKDGEDMERNGCIPDETIWPKPGELPKGIDRQLQKAVAMLLEEVGEGKEPKELKYSSQRDQD